MNLDLILNVGSKVERVETHLYIQESGKLNNVRLQTNYKQLTQVMVDI
jgi:hypothetical protein